MCNFITLRMKIILKEKYKSLQPFESDELNSVASRKKKYFCFYLNDKLLSFSSKHESQVTTLSKKELLRYSMNSVGQVEYIS